MKERNRLTIQMSLLFLIVFVTFGVIIVTEKLSPLKIPKITEKITNYFNSNYKEIVQNTKLNNVEYKNLKYQVKVINKKNNNHYFYIYYENKNISDTYKKDYVEGKSIITYQENLIKKNIKSKTGTNFKVQIPKKLNEYTDSIQEDILNSKNPEQLKIYTIEANITVSKFDTKNIVNTIKFLNNNLINKKITPKKYTFIITDPEDSTNAVKIENLTSEIIASNNITDIIDNIIKKKKSNLLNTYDIKYEYLN